MSIDSGGSHVTVRPLVLADISDAAEILCQAGICDAKDIDERLVYILKQENRLCFIADRGSSPAGVLIAHYNGFHVHLSHLAVRKENQRHGIATFLHASLRTQAKRQSAKGIIADSWLTATGFYYKLGYELPGSIFVINRLLRD